jgi:WD40 repeat protein
LPHPAAVSAAAVHPAGKLAVTGAHDGGVRVWDLDAAELRDRVGYHGARVNAVAWGPGDWLATAGDDYTARVWNARTMTPIGPPMRHAAAVLAVAFDPAGRRLLTVARDGAVAVWDLPDVR